MVNRIPPKVFLAGSTAELISALGCLVGLKITDAVIFVERNISFKTAAMDPLIAAARARFPSVQFVELAIERSFADEAPNKATWTTFLTRWRAAESIRKQLDAECRAHFGTGLKGLRDQAQEVYFTGLHDYVLVFLAALNRQEHVLYPHGFDHPRRQQAKEYGHLVRPRSVRTVLGTIGWQRQYFGAGGLAHGILGRMLPGVTTVSLPFTGVDRVLTFRADVDYVPNEVIHIQGLAEIFQWLLELPPWSDLLRERGPRPPGGSLMLLLSEYNRHPIWEENHYYGSAHLRLLQTVSRAKGLKRIVIKAHVRSDGTAANWMASFLKEHAKDWEIEILPLALHGLPVEALTLTGEFAGACSMGSCSLPPGLGFGIPHYVSPSASALFDEGWRGNPFWEKFKNSSRMLIDEGICRDIDKESTQSTAEASSPQPIPAKSHALQ